MLKYFKYILFLGIILVLFLLLKDGVKSEDFQTLILQAQWGKLALASSLVVVGMVLKAWRLKQLTLPFQIEISLLESFRIQTISISLAMMTPGRAGEFTKIYFLAKNKEASWGVCLMICIFERLFDFLILVGLATAFCLYYLANTHVLYGLFALGLCVITGLVILLKPDIFVKHISHFLPTNIKNILHTLQENQHTLLKKTPFMFVSTLIIWIIEALFHWMIFQSIAHHLSFLPLVGLGAIMTLASILTILPLGLGSMDLSAIFFYPLIFGLSNEVILFELMASRVLGLGALLILFIPSMWVERDFLKGIKSRKAAEAKTPITETEPPAD